MTNPGFRSWQSVHDEVLRRIQSREWAPGQMIPHEADLAREFGVARATVNRALRQIAETGLLDRRRKAGTRVTAQPVAKATFDIAIIRQEVDARGQRYQYQLLDRAEAVAPRATSAAMGIAGNDALLRLRALHLADGQPYVLEDRWINPKAAPGAKEESFTEISSNEWLLKNAPYTHGEIAFSAANASAPEADALACPPMSALFVLDQITWNGKTAVTKVRLFYAPGHNISATL